MRRLGPGGLLAVLTLLAVGTIVAASFSVLASVDHINASLTRLEGALVVATRGVDTLNARMTAVGRMARHMHRATVLTQDIGRSVGRSRGRIEQLQSGTARLDGLVGGVSASTGRIGSSLAGLDSGTSALAGSVKAVGAGVTPLVGSTAGLHGSIGRMGGRIGDMNGSLRYVIRILNYMSAPPGGGPFSIRVVLDPAIVPKIKGIKITTDAIPVFSRGRFPRYTGP